MSVALLAEMVAKLLQGLGVVFVVALVAGAIFGFVVLKDRVQIVVAPEPSSARPDPLALLRDDVQTIARDLAALQHALAANFEQLGTALEERANARHGDVLACRRDLAVVQQQLAAQAASSAQLAARIQEIAAGAASPEAATPAAAPNAAAGAPAPPVLPVNVEPGAANDPKAAPAPGKGFLSFSVPATTLHFDQLQDYTVVPELSRVGFDAKSTLHDFTGVTSQLRGSFRADFDDPQGVWTGEVVVQAASLATGVEGRDTNMRENLDTKNHAEIRFTIQRFQPAANGVDVAKQTARGDVVGTMRIRGQEKAFSMPVAIEVDPQKRVVISGQAPLKLSDYGVPVPSQLGLISMQDEVVVWIALRARVATASGGRK